MKVLFLGRYEDMGASTRLRSLQYLPYLKKDGIEVTVSPLLSNEYLRQLYTTRSRSLAPMMQSYFRRFRQLLTTGQYDLVWIEKELFPMLPAWAERYLVRKPYVVDYDDATFHFYDQHPKGIVRRLMGRKIDVVMKNAALVVAGNDYLAQRAKQAGAKRVENIPTVIDLEKYPYEQNSSQNDTPFTIGWIGSPATAKYLKMIQPALKLFCDSHSDVQIMLIGAGDIDLSDLPIQNVAWMEDTEVANVQQMDVGIMPLPDDHWERGKCGYKLIQYMACGKPVIASPVGVNQEIVKEGVNGFLAQNTEEWVAAFKTLYEDVSLRGHMGGSSRKIVEGRYCLQVTAPKLSELLQSASKS